MTRLLITAVLLIGAAWLTGFTISAAMIGNTTRLIGFAALTVAALSFAGVAFFGGKR